ncbi:hypothetical protein Patl1_30141 [Pistacia atlantica]|uniref:Uncharacterized protein n=1 Tax=Pistacia atlantica TaxID=434234 RepID=A0ACC1A8M0_9ROSI|nr:hypothetical protein Patl1_30141 [Pistacia atlantica]
MDFSKLQSRVNTPYIPPHRTQLHPRVHHPNPNPNSNFKVTSNRNKLLLLLASLFTIPSLYCLFSTARKLHQSAKFVEPNVQFYGIVIDSGLATARLRVFKFLGDGQMPFVDSTEARGDLDRSIQVLVGFAKKRVPKKEWANTRVQLMLNNAAEDRVLEQCRRVLRASGFAFKDAWSRVLEGLVSKTSRLCNWGNGLSFPKIEWIACHIVNKKVAILSGRTSKFWEDIWLAEAAFVGLFPRLYRMSARHSFNIANVVDSSSSQGVGIFISLEISTTEMPLCLMLDNLVNGFNLSWAPSSCYLAPVERHIATKGNRKVGQEKGMYAWIATNYALGTLGGEPQETIGIVELGGTSLQVTFAMRESSLAQSTQMIRFAGVTYDLYTKSLPQFGQEAAWKLLYELQNSTELKSCKSQVYSLLVQCYGPKLIIVSCIILWPINSSWYNLPQMAGV